MRTIRTDRATLPGAAFENHAKIVVDAMLRVLHEQLLASADADAAEAFIDKFKAGGRAVVTLHPASGDVEFQFFDGDGASLDT